MVSATSSGVSTTFDATSMQPTSTSLPLSSPISSIGTCELRHSSETWSIAARRERGKGLLILAPMLAERRLPVGVGLDAVAVADVDGGPASKTLRGALERGDAPVLDVAHVDVEGGLVELHHVDAERFELARLLVQRRGEGVGEGGAVAIMLVGDRVGDGHRAGQRELELAPGVGARGARLELVDGALAADRAGHRRDLGLVAVGADADRLPAREIDAVEIGEKAVHEMDARLLAVADDVDAGVFLPLHREDGGVDLAAASASPSSFQAGQSFSGSASQRGLGRLPATVVSNMSALSQLVVARRLGIFGRVAQRHQLGPGVVGNGKAAPS